MQWFFRDVPFLRRMMAVALPVSVQLLISTSINMADTVMISSLGKESIAAVGLVNQYVFFFMVVSFGICSAGAVFLRSITAVAMWKMYAGIWRFPCSWRSP